jgi:hypothetical protein
MAEISPKDFFISYNSIDYQWAEWIAWHLEDDGYSTVLQAWDFQPGSNFVLEMHEAAIQAERTIAVLSPDYLKALYTQPEWAAAFVQDPTGKKGTLLPVRVRQCEPKGLLKSIVYIDLVGLDELTAHEKLLAKVHRKRPKPEVSPNFPHLLDTDDKNTEDFLDSTTIREFFGPAVRLVKLAEFTPASDEEVQQYYKGAPLTWNLIAARGDIERDQYHSLIDIFTALKKQTYTLCLSGGPGSGKSTLAWRLATEISQTTGRPLVHILDNEEDEIWYKLEAFVQESTQPLIVLIDDVFRNNDARRALASLRPDLNITIIATSRINEIPYDLRLPFQIQIEEMGAPTLHEKTRVLQRLELYGYKLDMEREKYPSHADSWLVMMIEITTGEGLVKIVRDSVNRLRHLDEVIYRAYEYLCYAGQYDLAVPESLITRLDNQGHFYKLLEHPIGKGLIFGDSYYTYDEGHYVNMLRTQHPTIAHEALKIYRRDPLTITKEFIIVVQPSQRVHRLFLRSLLSRLALNQQVSLVRELLEHNAGEINAILLACSNSELIYWAALYRILNDQYKMAEIEDLVLNKLPEWSEDWLAYIRFVDQKGTAEQIATVINATATWLAVNPQDIEVRRTYLRLVESNGTAEQIVSVIDTTATWLTANPQGVEVLWTYLRIVKNRGTMEQLTSACSLVKNWLNHNPKIRKSPQIHFFEEILLKLER